MKKFPNGDGTVTIIFDSASEALDDCELGRYGDSDYFTEIRTDSTYYIQFIHKGKNDERKFGDVIRLAKKPHIKGNSIVYHVYNDKGVAKTLIFGLSDGVCATCWKESQKVWRKLVSSEKDDPEGSARFIYKYDPIERDFVDI